MKQRKSNIYFCETKNTYKLKFRINGEMKRIDLKTNELKVAERKADEIKATIRRLSAEGKRVVMSKPVQVLLAEVKDNIFANIRNNLDEVTYKTKVKTFLNVDYPFIAAHCKFISDLNDLEFIKVKYINWRKEYAAKKGIDIKNETLNGKLTIIKKMLDTAKDFKYIKEPLVIIKQLHVDESIKRLPIMPEEFKALMENCSLCLRAYLILTSFLALRTSEILKIQVKHLEKMPGSIFFSKCKNNNSKTLPVNSKIAPLVEKLKFFYPDLRRSQWVPRSSDNSVRIEEYVFRHSSRELDKQPVASLKKAFANAKKATGLDKGITIYSCRHGMAYFLDKNGCGANQVRCMLGQKSLQSTERYLRQLRTTDLEDVAEKIDWHVPEDMLSGE